MKGGEEMDRKDKQERKYDWKKGKKKKSLRGKNMMKVGEGRKIKV